MNTFNMKKRGTEHLVDDLKKLALPTSKQAKIYAPKSNSAKHTLFFASRGVDPQELKRKAQAIEEKLTKKTKMDLQDAKPVLSLGGENAVFSNFRLKRFADGATPITYKEGYINGKCQSNSVIHKIIEKRMSQLKPPAYQGILASVLEEGQLTQEPAYNGLSLVKLANQRWMIYDAISETYFQPEAGRTYIFVTMADNTIRVAGTSNGHAFLSNCAKYIRYAGEVVFDEQQKIVSWNNQSGNYYPSPFLAHQAGFGDGLARFEARYDRNDEKIKPHGVNDIARRAIT